MDNFGVLLLILVNILAFIQVGIDKKRSLKNEQRTPEGLLFFWAVIFGSLGVFLGMLFFRHKTRKMYFLFGVFFLMLLQAYVLSKVLKVIIW